MQEKLKIGQAPNHPLQLPGWGAHNKLELFYMNQGDPQIARMQGGIRNLGMLFHLALRGGLWPIDRPSLPPSTCLGVTSAGEWVVEERKITSWSNILSYELGEHPVQPSEPAVSHLQLSLYAGAGGSPSTSTRLTWRVVERHPHEPV